RPDLQIIMQPVSLPKFPGKPDPFRAFSLLACILRPKSRGCGKLKTPEFNDHPAIRTNVFSNSEDAITGANGLRVLQRIALQTHAFRRYRPEALATAVNLKTDDDYLVASYRLASTIYHGVGT